MKNSSVSPQLYTYKQVVEITQLSRMTIWRLISAGRFPAPLVLSSRCCRFPVPAVQAWLDGTWPPIHEVQK